MLMTVVCLPSPLKVVRVDDAVDQHRLPGDLAAGYEGGNFRGPFQPRGGGRYGRHHD